MISVEPEINVNERTAKLSAVVGTGAVNTKYCALSYLLSKFNDAEDAAAAAAPEPVEAPATDAVTFAIE